MNLAYIKLLSIKLLGTFISPEGWPLKSLFAIVMFFAGIHTYIISVIALVIIDVITGIWASVKRKEPFKSRILRQGLLEKLVLYMCLLVGAFFLGSALNETFGLEKHLIAGALTILIDVYEVSSIIENIIVVNPKLAFLNVFKDLINNLKDKQIKAIEKKLITQDKEESKNE